MIKKLSLILIFILFSTNSYADVWPNKPPIGVEIDWSNPVSRGLVCCFLFNEGSGRVVRNLALNKFASLTGWANPPVWSAVMTQGTHLPNYLTPKTGMSLVINAGGASNSLLPMTNQGYKFPYATSEITLLFFFRHNDFTGGTYDEGTLFYTQAGNGLLYFVVGFDGVDNSNTGKLATTVRADNNTGLTHIHGTTDVRDFKPHIGVLTIDKAKNMRIYLDGKLEASGTHTMTAGITGGSDRLFQGVGANSNILGQQYAFYMWTRALTSSEVRQLSYEPYCFLKKKNWLISPVAPPAGFPQVIINIL